MDRRQQKTRAAIFAAFSKLLAEKNYGKITVQEIIDTANIGRTTFYDHFETKDELLKALCEELFGHIVHAALDRAHTHGSYSNGEAPASVFLHLLQHLQENDRNILGLLSCESSDLFLRYFKNSLNHLVRLQLEQIPFCDTLGLPEDFLVNHISSTFVETVLWWLNHKQKQTPEELTGYFLRVIKPVLREEEGNRSRG